MKKNNNRTPFNTLLTGTIIGFVIPLISIYLFYCITPTYKSFGNFLQYAVTFKILTRLISLCAIPNLIAFFLLMHWNHLYAARGIILATFLITFGVVIFKVFI